LLSSPGGDRSAIRRAACASNASPGLGENRRLAGSCLKATMDHAAIKRIEFDPAANATPLLGGDESRAGAEEGVHDALSRCHSISAKG
jgi:hypothetical protein